MNRRIAHVFVALICTSVCVRSALARKMVRRRPIEMIGATIAGRAGLGVRADRVAPADQE